MANGEDGFGKRHPWEETSPVKRRVVSNERVKALYCRRGNAVVKVPEKSSLESEVAQNEPEKGYGGERVSDVDKERIYAIAVENLEKRKQKDYRCIRWQTVEEEVCSSLPHLRGIPIVRIQNIYGTQLKNRSKKSGGRRRRKDVFTSKVCAALYETFQRYVDPDSTDGRIKHGSWPKIYKEMREKFPALNEVGGSAINEALYEEQRRIGK